MHPSNNVGSQKENISSVENASLKKWLIRTFQEKKIIRKRSESGIRDSRSLCGGPSHDHMFEELLTQKDAPGPPSDRPRVASYERT